MNTTKTSKTSVEDLNEQLMQESLTRQKRWMEEYWDMMNPSLEKKKVEMQTNPVSESIMYQMYKERESVESQEKNVENQSPNEAPLAKPTLLEVMERFRGKNLFPEATERTRTYLERMGFQNMPHPNPMSPIVETEEEREREALMTLLQGQINNIKEKGV